MAAEKNELEWENIFCQLTRENLLISHRENAHNFMWKCEQKYLLESVGRAQFLFEKTPKKSRVEWQKTFYQLTRRNYSLFQRENAHTFMWKSE